jgi:hypothetical protein
MGFEGSLLHKKPIETFIESRMVDLLWPHPEDVLKCCAAIPVFCDVEFARRLAEPCDHEDRCNLRPGDDLAAHGDRFLAEGVQPEHAPELPGQPHVSESSHSAHVHLIKMDPARFETGVVFEQVELIGARS